LLVTESMGKCLLRSNETWLCCAPRAEGCNCNGGTLAVVLGAKGAPQIQFWDLNDLGWSDGLWCTVTLVACTTCEFQALRAASGRVKQDYDGSWMDSLLFCYMCSLLHRQKCVVALFCETKKEFCGTYEHFIKFFHSHPKQWSNVKHIHSICRMRRFMIDSSQAEVQMEAMQKLQVRHVVGIDGKCQPVSCEFPPKEVTKSLPSPQWLEAWLKSQSHQWRPRPKMRPHISVMLKLMNLSIIAMAAHPNVVNVGLVLDVSLRELVRCFKWPARLVALSVGEEMASQTTSWRHVREPCSVRTKSKPNYIKLHQTTSNYLVAINSTYFIIFPHNFTKNSALWMRGEVAYITPVFFVRSTSQSPMLIEDLWGRPKCQWAFPNAEDLSI
jgi:hypothetical protein